MEFFQLSRRRLRFVLQVVLFSELTSVLADVQQQYLKTQTVIDTALTDGDWPSAIGTHNDVQDSQAWTNNNQNVRRDSVVQLEFAENIQAGYGYITVQPAISTIGTSSAAATTITVPSADVVVSGASLFINSGGSRADIFAEVTTYTISFDAGIVENLGSTDTNAAFSIQFTTGDFTSPSNTAKSPVKDAPNVDVSSSIVLTFSENVQANAAAVSIDIMNVYERQTPYYYTRPCNDPSVTISGNEVTIALDPLTLGLLPCEKYQVVFSAKCFYDTSINNNWAASLPASAQYMF